MSLPTFTIGYDHLIKLRLCQQKGVSGVKTLL